MNEKRQQSIVAQLKEQKLTGQQLAKQYNVTRQVIVKDIAILRAGGYDIISTPRGYYIAEKKEQILCVIKSVHDDSYEHISTELLTIVENGGTIIDVIVEHDVYHEIRIVLDLSTVADVKNYLAKVAIMKDRPLSVLTHGVHYHTIAMNKKEQQQQIFAALRKLENIECTIVKR